MSILEDLLYRSGVMLRICVEISPSVNLYFSNSICPSPMQKHIFLHNTSRRQDTRVKLLCIALLLFTEVFSYEKRQNQTRRHRR